MACPGSNAWRPGWILFTACACTPGFPLPPSAFVHAAFSFVLPRYSKRSRVGHVHIPRGIIADKLEDRQRFPAICVFGTPDSLRMEDFSPDKVVDGLVCHHTSVSVSSSWKRFAARHELQRWPGPAHRQLAMCSSPSTFAGTSIYSFSGRRKNSVRSQLHHPVIIPSAIRTTVFVCVTLLVVARTSYFCGTGCALNVAAHPSHTAYNPRTNDSFAFCKLVQKSSQDTKL